MALCSRDLLARSGDDDDDVRATSSDRHCRLFRQILRCGAEKKVESFFKREFSLVCDEDVYRSRRKPRICLHATYSLQIAATPEVRTARPQDETACPVLATCCLSLIQGRLSLIDYLLMYIFDKNIIN